MTNIISITIAVIAVLVSFFFWYRQRGSEKLKQEFIAVVTHKFRTPMTGIRWAINMLRNDVNLQQKDDLIKEIERANERLVEIVDLLTGFSTFENKAQYSYQFISLPNLIQTTLPKYSQMIRDKKMHFDIDISSDAPAVYIDKSRIQFVLDTLLENALRYTPPNGYIGIKLIRQGQTVILSISDTGMGLSPAEMKKMFKKFWRGDYAKTIDPDGMGLGLHTTKAIVEHHGGRIWVQSKGRDQGATFYVQLKISGYGFKFR
jgi:Amt family ammonium transporter